MNRRQFLGFIVFPALVAGLVAFLVLVANIGIFAERSLAESLEDLKSEDKGVRLKAAIALGTQKDATAVPALREALANDPSLEVQLNAAQSLVLVLGKDAEKDLAPLLESKDPDARRVACYSLGQLGATGALDALKRRLADEDATVQWNAAVAVALLGDPASVPTLNGMLASSNRENVRDALGALLRTGDASSAAAVERLLGIESDPDLRALASYVLTRIKSRLAKA